MKLAHILPIQATIDGFTPTEQNVHLTLANLVLKHDSYARWFEDKVNDGETVILDCPVHEYEQIDAADWINAVRLIRPTVAVLPDVIESAARTIQRADYAMRQAKDVGLDCAFMGVPHGNDDIEYVGNAIRLRNLGATWFGISLERRLLNDKLAYLVREKRLRLLVQNPHFEGCRFHFLGISERAMEFVNPFIQKHVYSADASKFALWNLVGNEPYPPAPLSTPYPGRAILGGSMEYFDYEGYVSEEMTMYLSTWTKYAEEGAL